MASILTILAAGSGQAARGQDAPLSDSHRQAIVELMEVSHVQSNLETSLATMTDMMLDGGPPELRQVLDDFFAQYFSWSQLEEQFVALYGSTFTEDEARQLTAFYSTPVGAKAADAVPVLMQKGAEIGQRQVEAHLPDLQRMIEEAMRAPTPPVLPNG